MPAASSDDAKAKTAKKLRHLEWAISSRAANQQSCLTLLKLFDDYPEQWSSIGMSVAAQNLVSVGFSLWRAAFLADKTGRRTEVFSHGRDFLEKMIEDNAIAYVQDKKSQEWTFNYYTRNARFALERLAHKWPKRVPMYKAKTRTATERWDYCHELFVAALAGVSTLLSEKAAAPKPARKTKASAKGEGAGGGRPVSATSAKRSKGRNSS